MGFLSWIFGEGEKPTGKIGEISGRSINKLIKELGDRNADTALGARDQLRLAGEDVVSATARCLLRRGPTQQRYLAAQVLGDIGNNEAVDALMAVLNDRDPVVCAWSARSLVPSGDKRALKAVNDCIRRLPAGTGRSIVEGAAQHLEKRLSKRTVMEEELREDTFERLWDVKEAKAQHADLLEANVIPSDELAETNIYEVIALKEGVEIHEGDSIKLRGLQICPATRISTAVDTDISWGNSSTLSCEVCGELRLTGVTTSQGGRETKYFLLLHKKRLPSDEGFLPHLEILQISLQVNPKRVLGYACELKDARGEVGELEAANEIKVSTLREMCGAAYRLISTPQETIKVSDRIKASGTLTCSVCKKDFELDVQLEFEGFFRSDSHQNEKCPQCGALIDIYGVCTEQEGGEAKFWILVLRNTVPAGAPHGTFSLVLRNARIVG